MTRVRLVGIALGLVVAGCKGEPPPPPPRCDQIVEVHLRASSHINPGDDGSALPVVLRFYQLKDRAKFDSADFQALWQDDVNLLGGDALDRVELELFPSTREEKRYWRKAEAGYFAVVAIFRKPGAEGWRRVFPLPDAAMVRNSCKQEKQ